ncbi:acyltransferase [Pseudoprevotella muciniphila]|uniref:Acyltransferase n=1 Tax=Pseudoprevotella muciniphila TaxID=2133944 RepID=A0A5P8E912_9BACT|nr:acyltransferase [Pseudoprevotella muciniphila]QFQ13413.1 acyltransferase [Pseudoprevotella muciniphila]
MIKTTKGTHLAHLDFLRGLCVLTVVVFHCYAFLTHGHFLAMRETYLQFDRINYCGPIVIAMPLFTFISGYLYAYLRGIGKYSKDKPFIKNKVRRLLLPFIFFVTFFCITTEFQQTDLTTLIKHIGHCIAFGAYNHLWYLPVLFWCFIIIRIFERLSNSKIVLLLFLVIAYILAFVIPVSGFLFNLGKVAPWFYWFLLGYTYFKFRDSLMLLFSNRNRKITLLLLVCVCEIGLIHFFGFPDYKRPQFIASEFVIISIFIIALFIVFEDLTKSEKIEKIFTNNLVKSISKYSFGIYIFHYWLAPIIISSTAKRVFHLEAFAEHYYIFPIVFSIATFIASYIVTYLFQKTKLGKYLLG